MTAMPSSFVATDPRYDAVVRRDPQMDGRFWYSVATTGVYCRPSCAARTPRAENVAFHASPEAAEAAGFRACKRCRPREPDPAARHAALIADLCLQIEAAEATPTLDDLARRSGLSPFHLHRLFKAHTGVTPRAWARAARARRLRQALESDESVTGAIYAAGYGSSSRMYEASGGVLGMTPRQFRQGGRDSDIRFAVGPCKLGHVLVAASAKGVVAIYLGDDPEPLVHELQDRFPEARLTGDDPAFAALVAVAAGLAEGKDKGAGLPLDLRGTAFQQRVWQALVRIPAGETRTYAEIAAGLGQPSATRAVAGACAANHVAMAIPCHRVVRSDGSLSGYRWGVARKAALLASEAPKRREG